MSTVLVTGATGLIGANICRLLRDRGDEVRALVRPASDAGELRALGVDVVPGDITVEADVHRAADGVDAVVNSAALLGAAEQDLEQQIAANHLGSLYCYDAAREGQRRVIELTTTPFLRHDQTLTEHPEMRPESELGDDAYAISKGRAFKDGRDRVEQGEDIVFVVPGGTFGPSPVVARSMAATSFNRLVRGAVRGRLTDYASFPVPWVRAEDVATCVVRALDDGEAGAAYLAFGAEQPTSVASFLNLACELAGVEHRVTDVVISADDPDARTRYGATVFELATRVSAEPHFDNAETRRVLGYEPLALQPSMEETVAWMQAHRLFD